MILVMIGRRWLVTLLSVPVIFPIDVVCVIHRYRLLSCKNALVVLFCFVFVVGCVTLTGCGKLEETASFKVGGGIIFAEEKLRYLLFTK